MSYVEVAKKRGCKLQFLEIVYPSCDFLEISFSSAFDLDDLLVKARFYGLDPDLLLSLLSDPFLFDPFALCRSLALPILGRDRPATIFAAPSGSLLVAHGSKITVFDPALRRCAIVFTRFPAVDSLLVLSPSLAAAGATDFPCLQLLDLSLAGCVAHTLHWFPPCHRHNLLLRCRRCHRPSHWRLPRSPFRQLRVLPEER